MEPNINKYKKWYNELINKARDRELSRDIITEKHHIIPKCLGGGNHKSNLVKLLVREHIVAHLLLVRVYPENKKLIYALNAMISNRKTIRKPEKYLSTRQLEKIRELFINSCKGRKLSEESKNKISKANKGRVSPNKGKKMTDEAKQNLSTKMSGENHFLYGKSLPKEWKENISKSLKGHQVSDITKEKISNALKGEGNPNFGKTFSKERKEKMSKAQLGEKHHYFGKKLSEDHRRKMSEAHLKNPPKNSIKVKGPDGTIYSSISQASRCSGLSVSTISKYLKLSNKGWKIN